MDKKVTDQSFNAQVLEASKVKPILTKFTADWCGPCRAMAPILERIASDNKDKIDIVELNVDENPQTANLYKISSIPTMMVFVDGKVVKTIMGAKSKLALEKDLTLWLK